MNKGEAHSIIELILASALALIVGAGGAGMTAAIHAVEAGKDVILLEKMPYAGGNTTKATGGMNAAETHYQEEAGIEDSVEQFIEDTITGGHNLNNRALVTVMAENLLYGSMLGCATTTCSGSPASSTRAPSKAERAIGAKNAVCMGLSAACSGFVYAMTMADNMIRFGQIKTAAVIGVETLSRIVDWADRNTCVLFGDGAGAMIVRAAEGEGTAQDTGVLATKIYADGTQAENLYSTGGVALTKSAGFVKMNGKEVFKFAVGAMCEASDYVLKAAQASITDVNWLLPHQANSRIIAGVGQKLGVPDEKVIITVDHHGNTSAASIPLAFSESVADGKIKKGDLVLIPAMGAGFTWGGLLIRF